MKKNLFILVIAMITVSVAKAQFNFSNIRVDVGANYTMYKGDFQKKTPGAKLRASFLANQKFAVGLGFTYGFPIKIPSTITYSGGSSVPSEVVYNFKTISLDVNYYFGGEKEEGLSFYGGGGAALVLVSYKEKLKGTAPSGQNPADQLEPGNESGFTLNLCLGTQYALGRAKIFADAGIALPANQVNDQYVTNVIPAHFMFNLGVRFSLGSESE
jgi:opacity protein-like surface antigen